MLQTTLFVAILLLICDVNAQEDELIMVNLLFRHGARSPVAIYPTDPNINYWPDGPGRLTQKGMRMEYDLGLFLKTRYVDTKFVNQSYLHKEVYIRSSGTDRCLQSAESQLAALYPPKGWQEWNQKLGKQWQPIPIQTVPRDEDPILRPEDTKNCPAYSDLIEDMMKNSKEFQQKVADNTELIKYLRNNSGWTDLSVNDMWKISDTTISELTEGLTPPQWVMDRFDEIRSLAFYLFSFRYTGSDLLGRLTGGTLLGIMNGNMKNYTVADEADKNNYHKLNLFSGHDSSIFSLSAALDIQITKEIPFAASVIVELYKNKTSGAFYVTMIYRHNTTLTPWKVAGCDFNCPLDDFISLTKARIPTDRQVDCKANPDPGFFTYHRLTVISAVLLSLTIFFFIIIAWICIRKRFKKSKSKDYEHAAQSRPLIQ